jgi:hypothetical protein
LISDVGCAAALFGARPALSAYAAAESATQWMAH